MKTSRAIPIALIGAAIAVGQLPFSVARSQEFAHEGIRVVEIIGQAAGNAAEEAWKRGNAHLDQRNYEGAIEEYSKAIEINPDYVHAYNNRGNIYRRQGEYEKAIEDFSQAIRINPDYAWAYNNRGSTYSRQGEYEKAIEDYSQAIRIKPDYADFYYNRGLARRDAGERQGAIEDFRRAADLYKNRGNNRLYDDAIEKIEDFSE